MSYVILRLRSSETKWYAKTTLTGFVGYYGPASVTIAQRRLLSRYRALEHYFGEVEFKRFSKHLKLLKSNQ